MMIKKHLMAILVIKSRCDDALNEAPGIFVQESQPTATLAIIDTS